MICASQLWVPPQIPPFGHWGLDPCVSVHSAHWLRFPARKIWVQSKDLGSWHEFLCSAEYSRSHSATQHFCWQLPVWPRSPPRSTVAGLSGMAVRHCRVLSKQDRATMAQLESLTVDDCYNLCKIGHQLQERGKTNIFSPTLPLSHTDQTCFGRWRNAARWFGCSARVWLQPMCRHELPRPNQTRR